MGEEKLSSFNARQVVLEGIPAGKPCIFFITNRRVIAASIEGVSSWAAAPVLVALAGSFIALVLRDFLFFLAGITAAITAGVLVVVIDYLIRYNRQRKLRNLSPDGIMNASKRNLELPYSEIEKVAVTESSSFSRANLFVPSFFQEQQYVFDFIVKENRHTFIFGANALQPCLELLRKFVAEKIVLEEL